MTTETAPRYEATSEDFFVWSDGTYCVRSELSGFTYMSDDWEVLYFGSPEWQAFVEAQDNIS